MFAMSLLALSGLPFKTVFTIKKIFPSEIEVVWQNFFRFTLLMVTLAYCSTFILLNGTRTSRRVNSYVNTEVR
jgi:hypothetical protein